jgi:hypothetical protein
VDANNNPTGTAANVVVEKYYYNLPNVTSESDFFEFASNVSNPTDANTNSPNQAVPWGTQKPNPSTTGVLNAYGFVRKGEFIYVISYDVGRVTRINASTGAIVDAVDRGPIGPSGSQLDAHAQGIALWKGEVWALFNATTNSSSYNNSVVDRVYIDNNNEIQLDTANEVQVSMNAVNLVVAGDYLYVPCIGGMQQAASGNGTASTIHRISLSSGNPVSQIAYEGVSSATYDFHGVAVGEEWTLVLAYNYNSNYNADWALYKVSTATFNNAVSQPITSLATRLDFGTGASGYFWAVTYEVTNKHFWFAKGNPITIYPYNPGEKGAEVPKSFSVTELYDGVAAAANITALDITIDKIAPTSGTDQTVMRSAVAHEVAMGEFPSQAAYIEYLKKKNSK